MTSLIKMVQTLNPASKPERLISWKWPMTRRKVCLVVTFGLSQVKSFSSPPPPNPPKKIAVGNSSIYHIYFFYCGSLLALLCVGGGGGMVVKLKITIIYNTVNFNEENGVVYKQWLVFCIGVVRVIVSLLITPRQPGSTFYECNVTIWQFKHFVELLLWDVYHHSSVVQDISIVNYRSWVQICQRLLLLE